MRITNRLERLAVAGTIATAVAVGALAPVAHAEPDAPDVPSTIAVPEGHKVFLVGHAVGVQIYSCNDVAGAYRWGSPQVVICQ